MVDLAMKALSKTDDSDERYAFLGKCFRDRYLVMQEIFKANTLSQDPIALTTYLNMGAISISIIGKTYNSKETYEMGMERVSNRQDTAKNIVDILKASWETRMIEVSPQPSVYHRKPCWRPNRLFCTLTG